MFNVMIAAESVSEGVAERALFMSGFDRGEPVTTVRPGQGVRVLDARTRAIAV